MGVKEYKRHSARVTRSKRWKSLRPHILRRDDYRCRKCGARGQLEVDHIKPVRDAPELAYEPSNLQALCKPCHSAKTKKELGFSKPHPERTKWQKMVNALCEQK